MKLIFLGTGHGVPAPDRHCSATLLEVGGKRYLIDGGAPVVDIMRARGIPVDGLSAVFVTHRHSDHTFGLAMLSTSPHGTTKRRITTSTFPNRHASTPSAQC